MPLTGQRRYMRWTRGEWNGIAKATAPPPVKIKTYKFSFIDKTGKVVFETTSKERLHPGAAAFSEGLAIVRVQDNAAADYLYGFIDPQGNFVIKPQFKSMPGSFSEGLSVVVRDGKFKYIDKTGKTALEPDASKWSKGGGWQR